VLNLQSRAIRSDPDRVVFGQIRQDEIDHAPANQEVFAEPREDLAQTEQRRTPIEARSLVRIGEPLAHRVIEQLVDSFGLEGDTLQGRT
jgi:hypothetical protein